MCILKLMLVDSNEETREVASQNVNMAPFVNRDEAKQTIYFDEGSEIEGASIDIEWTITSDTS